MDVNRHRLLGWSVHRGEKAVTMLRARLKPIPLLFCAIFSVSAMAAEESAAPAPAPAEALPDVLPEERSTVLPAPVPEGVPSLQMSTDYGSPILALGGYRPAGEM